MRSFKNMLIKYIFNESVSLNDMNKVFLKKGVYLQYNTVEKKKRNKQR
jgi:hypothetical protein